MKWFDRLLWLAVILAAIAAVAVPVLAVRSQDDEASNGGPARAPATALEKEATDFALRFARSVRAGDLLGACRLTAPPAFQAYGCGTAEPRIPRGLAYRPGERLEAIAVEVDEAGRLASVTIPVRGGSLHRYRLSRIQERWRVIESGAFGRN